MPDHNSTLTAANSVITLSIAGLFSAPQQLQGFSADNIFEIGDQTVTEVLMGVDGRLSGGFVFNAIEQTFDLQADSPSNSIFETWAAQQARNRDTYVATGVVTLKSVGTKYSLTRGFLGTLPPLPSAAKILQPRKYLIHWESVQAVPT